MEEAVPDGFGQVVQWMAVFFYTDKGLLAFPRPSRIQADLAVLKGLFESVGLHTNMKRTVGMVCQPCRIVGGHSEVEYMWRMKVVGPSFF